MDRKRKTLQKRGKPITSIAEAKAELGCGNGLVSRARAMANMDQSGQAFHLASEHRQTILDLCDEVDRLKKALAGHLFDGESVSAREAIRSELLIELADENASLRATRPVPIPKEVLLDKATGRNGVKRDFIGGLFLSAFSKAFPIGKKGDAKLESQAAQLIDDKEISLVLVANGVPMDAVAVCEEWDKQVDRMVAEKAVELLDKEAGAVREAAEEMSMATRNAIRKFKEKVGLSEGDDW